MGRVGGVDADHHEDEEEHHEDRAGVDGHLDDAHERGLEHGVEERQAHHVGDDADGRVDGAPGDEQPEDGQGDHDDGDHAEEEGFAGGDVQGGGLLARHRCLLSTRPGRATGTRAGRGRERAAEKPTVSQSMMHPV